MSNENTANGTQLSVLAEEIRHFRKKKNFSLEALADISGVSRSMISKIEGCETVPSTVILSKLAEALGVTFSQLMAPAIEREVIHIPAARQPILRDQETGFLRRCISPVVPGRGIDWVLNTLPAAILDDLSIQRAVICGVSLGGLTAMWLGIHAQNRVDGLVLANTAASFPPDRCGVIGLPQRANPASRPLLSRAWTVGSLRNIANLTDRG